MSVAPTRPCGTDLLHGLDLGSRADTTDREPNIDGRADPLVEELRLQEDLKKNMNTY